MKTKKNEKYIYIYKKRKIIERTEDRKNRERRKYYKKNKKKEEVEEVGSQIASGELDGGKLDEGSWMKGR